MLKNIYICVERTINVMNLLGPSSFSKLLYYVFKIAFWWTIVTTSVVGLHVIFGLLDRMGWENPIASLFVSETQLELNMKLLGTYIISEGSGMHIGLIIAIIVGTFGFYIGLTHYLNKMFFMFSSDRVFLPQVAFISKRLSYLLLGTSAAVGILLLFVPDNRENVLFAFTFFLLGLTLLFLSAVIDRGIELQNEIDLTI